MLFIGPSSLLQILNFSINYLYSVFLEIVLPSMQACNLDLGVGDRSQNSLGFFRSISGPWRELHSPFLTLWVETVGLFMEPCACIWLGCDEAIWLIVFPSTVSS